MNSTYPPREITLGFAYTGFGALSGESTAAGRPTL